MKRFALALGASLALTSVIPAVAIAGCSGDQVEIRLASGGQVRFSVEVAAKPADRAKGLMFRETMPASAGMLFIYERPQHAVFWMKNTLIPLDMIFADANGLVKHVHANAIPHDETGIDGGTGVFAVLEINGGLAKKLGITEGAVLRHPDLEQSTAIWSCEVD
jgi:uncharacterized membrane protein (UPF0127 family)